MSAGCIASRASIAGACLGALGASIPDDWVSSTAEGKKVVALVDDLLKIRQEMGQSGKQPCS